MNDYIEAMSEITEAASDLLPSEVTVMVNLAKLAFNTFGDNDNGLNSLYKKAFKDAVEKVEKSEKNRSIKELLNNCKEINSLEDVQNIPEYLKKISWEMELSLSENAILLISRCIVEQFNSILLEDKYEKLYKYVEMCSRVDVNGDLNKIKEILNELYNRTFNVEIDNKSYALNYISPLFMHTRQEPFISLKDIFVMPNTQDEYYEYNTLEIIRDFIVNDDSVLFI